MGGKRKKLKNYVEFQLPSDEPDFSFFRKEGFGLLKDETGYVLSSLLKKANIKKSKIALSLPDFSSFFTTFDLPPMTEAEVPQAVEFEARHHVPIPFSEVTFDWKIIKKENISPGVKLKILLVAVPNVVLHSYNKAAAFVQVDLDGMEAEVFGLIRSSIPENLVKKPTCLVDIGWETTTISIAENGSLRQSHSFDISAKTFNDVLCEKLNVNHKEADSLKRKYGLNPEKKDVFDALISKASLIAGDIRMTCEEFTRAEGLKVDNVILAGGTASLFGLKEYIGQYLKKQTQIADPFARLSFPSVLKGRLKELGSSFGVAIGVAMRGVES